MRSAPFLTLTAASLAAVTLIGTPATFAQTVPACFDGADNDGDLLVDMDDPGCLLDPLGHDESDSGSNSIVLAPDGTLVIIATAGADRISIGSYSNGDVRLAVNGAYTRHASVARIFAYGLGGNDTVTSTVTVPTAMHGGNGDDYLAGYLGDDILVGGPGNDRLFPHAGTNVVMGQSGNDTIGAKGGWNVLHGGDGNDTISGGEGRNILIGAGGKDTLRGGSDDDVLIGDTTLYDDDVRALIPTLDVWASDDDVLARIDAIQNADGIPVLTHGGTVTDDGEIDTLTCYLGRDVAYDVTPDKLFYADRYCAGVIDTPAESPASVVGNLYVTQGSLPVRPQYLLGGERSASVLHLEALADGEPVEVTYLGFNVAEGAGQSIDRIELFVDGQNAPFAAAFRGAALNGDAFGVPFPTDQFVVPANEKVRIAVKAVVKTDENGGISGEPIALTVPSVHGRGQVSAVTLATNDGDSAAEGEVFIGTATTGPDMPIVGTAHVVTMSKIVSAENSNTDPDGTPVPLGDSVIARFTFGAAANNNTHDGLNKVVLDRLVFDIVAPNVEFATGAFLLFNGDNMAVGTADYAVEHVSEQTQRITFDALSLGPVNTEVDPGSSIELVLTAAIARNQVILDQPAALQVIANTGADGLTWIDRDADTANAFQGARLPETFVDSTHYAN